MPQHRMLSSLQVKRPYVQGQERVLSQVTLLEMAKAGSGSMIPQTVRVSGRKPHPRTPLQELSGKAILRSDTVKPDHQGRPPLGSFSSLSSFSASAQKEVKCGLLHSTNAKTKAC